MKAWSLILVFGLSVASAQAFSGAAGPHPRTGRLVHVLGRYGGAAFFPDAAPPMIDAPESPIADAPYVEQPWLGPPYPQPPGTEVPYGAPSYIPGARPRRSGPHIIYIRKPRDVAVPRVIYGTD